MNSQKYLNAVLTAICVLLLVNLIAFLSSSRSQLPLEFTSLAYAQSRDASSDILFYPVGNQEVRRLVLFDRKSGTVYDYDNDGDLKNIWVIGKPGDKIQKKK